jgi:hypothetical protein
VAGRLRTYEQTILDAQIGGATPPPYFIALEGSEGFVDCPLRTLTPEQP